MLHTTDSWFKCKFNFFLPINIIKNTLLTFWRNRGYGIWKKNSANKSLWQTKDRIDFSTHNFKNIQYAE